MEKNKSTITVVCDAGPLIHLDELDSLDLLSGFSRILIPEVVWNEALGYRPGIERFRALRFEKVPPSEIISDRLKALGRLFTLHRGEIDALALCFKQKDPVLLTDDTSARLAARQAGIKTHGTIGLILRAIRLGLRSPDDVIELLQLLPNKSTLYIRRELLEEAISAVKAGK
jgi:predicted nucleic acid-binding protein